MPNIQAFQAFKNEAENYLKTVYAEADWEVISTKMRTLTDLLAMAASSNIWAAMPQEDREEIASFVHEIQETMESLHLMYHGSEISYIVEDGEE